VHAWLVHVPSLFKTAQIELASLVGEPRNVSQMMNKTREILPLLQLAYGFP
jgi:hypothetical protein